MKQLLTDLDWVKEMIAKKAEHHGLLSTAPAIDAADENAYVKFVTENNLNPAERFLLALSLVPFLSPASLNPLVEENNPYALAQYAKTGLILPTGEWYKTTSFEKIREAIRQSVNKVPNMRYFEINLSEIACVHNPTLYLGDFYYYLWYNLLEMAK